MSFIIRDGNLTETPVIRNDPETGRPYCFARVAVNDRSQNEEGAWVTVGTTFYNLTVRGNQAERLVDLSESSGNIRLVFAGRYRVRKYERRDGGQGISHDVSVTELGVSLKGQDVQVHKTRESVSSESAASTELEEEEWRQYAAY